MKCIDDEVPFEIPVGWEWCRIANLFLHASGKQQSRSNKAGGTPQKFITTSNLYWGYFVLDNVKIMNFTKDEIKNCSATKGDLLVCEGGAGYGRSAIWDKDYDICLQNHVHRLRPCINGLCEYVYYLIFLLKESSNLASVGTAMPGLSANRLKGLLVPFPPLKEQKRIVERLQQLMPFVKRYNYAQDALDALNFSIKEKLCKSILQEAIQGKLVPQDSNDESASVLLKRIRAEKEHLIKEKKIKRDKNESVIFKGDDNSYYEKLADGIEICIDDEIPFELPESWSWCRLGSICQLIIGKTPPRGDSSLWGDGIYPWVSISDMTEYGYILSTKEKISQKAAKNSFGERISKKESLLMSFKLTIGRTSILKIDAFHNEAIITVKPYFDDNFSLRNYLFRVLPILSNIGESKDAIKGKTLNSKSLSNLLIPISSHAELFRICQMMDRIF